MRTLLALSALALAIGGMTAAAQPEPAPAPAPVALECLLAEGAELDGAAGFSVPFSHNGNGALRCVIMDGKNFGVTVASSPTYAVPPFASLYAADFRGQVNGSVLVFGYIPGTNKSTNTVKAKIVNNPSQ